MIDYTAILSLILGLISGGSLTWLFTIKSEKLKRQAEAEGEQQDVYQEIITDLREDRRLMKEERDSLILDVNELQISVRTIQDEIKVLKQRHSKEQCMRFECKERLFG